MIPVEVVFLGPSRDFAGVESVRIELADGTTVSDLRRVLADRYPNLGGALPTIRLAINSEFAGDEAILKPGDEVALIPPVSGGEGPDAIRVELVSEPIAFESVRDFVMGDAKLGGIVTFEGATRAETDEVHGPLVRLDYEAYEGMARTQLERIALEARRRWSLGRVAIVHRLGFVPLAEVSVMIAVAGRHRKESFEACRWLIDALKQDVPIWKKDVFQDGFTRWVEP